MFPIIKPKSGLLTITKPYMSRQFYMIQRPTVSWENLDQGMPKVLMQIISESPLIRITTGRMHIISEYTFQVFNLTTRFPILHLMRFGKAQLALPSLVGLLN